MSTSELDRLQNDLNTIRTVTGGDLPFDRWDASWTLATGCFTALPAIVGMAGVQTRWVLLLSSIPFVAAVIFAVVRNYRAAHSSKSCPHEKRKEYRLGNAIMLVVVVPLLFGFRFWAMSAGAPAAVANGCVMMFLGLLLVIEGLYKSGKRAVLLPGIVAIAGGCMWPYCNQYQLWTLLFTAVSISLFGASAIMYRQLAVRVQRDDCAD
jgi:hypothetical protein